MRKTVFTLFALASIINFTSCDNNDIDDNQELIEVLGTWEMYRNENLESVIDQWTGTEWTYKDEWFTTKRNDSQIILVFNEDGTFVDRYADVEVAYGTWFKIEEGRYYFEYNNEFTSLNEAFSQRRILNIFCDNTFSIAYEGDDKRIDYFRKINTTECSNLIVYKVAE